MSSMTTDPTPDSTLGLLFNVKFHEDEPPTLVGLRDADGFIDPELQAIVEREIRQYPVMDARQWLGGVAAIRAVERWLIDRADNGGPDGTQRGDSDGTD